VVRIFGSFKEVGKLRRMVDKFEELFANGIVLIMFKFTGSMTPKRATGMVDII
jgi:hypothetical protein